jgi:hypothetical protein
MKLKLGVIGILLIVAGLFLVTACTKKPALPEPICKLMFSAATASANVISTTLQCQNTPAIAADLSDQIVKLGLCSDTMKQSTLSDILCPQLSAMVASLTTTAIPTEWECSATAFSDIIKSQIAETCVKVIK